MKDKMNQSVHKIKIIVLILLFSSIQNFKSNAESAYKPIIYKAYINGDMNKWASVIYTIEKQNPTSVEGTLELISYYYGYTAFLIGTKKYESAQKNIDAGEKHINEVLKLSPRNATAYAFKGSFLGFRIGLSKFKAISLGPESNRYITKASELEPQNIQGIVDKANALYHTPKLFGGDKKGALLLFQNAMKLMEIEKLTDKNWFYLNVMTLTAQAHVSLGELVKAKAIYEKAIRFEPGYKWVKNELYPELLKKM